MSSTTAAIDCAWNLVINSPTGTQHSVVTLKSDGGVLTGTISNDSFGLQEIEGGKYDGETLTWKSKITKPLKLTVSYVATLDENNNMKGHINAAMTKIKFTGTPA